MNYVLISMLLFSRICKVYAKKICIVLASPLGLVMCLEGTACSSPHRYGLLQQRSQSKISKGKRHVGPNSEETRPGLPTVFSQWDHTRCASFLQQHIVTTHEKCLPGKLIRDSVPKVFTGVWSCGTLCLALSKFQSPRRKARVQHKPTVRVA